MSKKVKKKEGIDQSQGCQWQSQVTSVLFLRVAGPHSNGLPDRLTRILHVNSCLIPQLRPFHRHVDPDFKGRVTFLYLCRWAVRRRQWHPTPVLLPGKSHGWRNLVGCSPWGREESDTTERLHFLFSPSYIGEGNGNPLQYSCLENPRDGGAWWAAVCGVTQSRTRLKRLSSSSSSGLAHSRQREPAVCLTQFLPCFYFWSPFLKNKTK